VDGRDDAQARFAPFAWAVRLARSFFFRWRSFFQRLVGREPLPMG
jgi:hypothetical protein